MADAPELGHTPRDDLAAALERVAGGDADAFAEVYRGAVGRVHGLVQRIVVGRALSEEVTQEVFLDVWSQAASFDRGRGSATTWILTLARRRAIDRTRSDVSPVDRSAPWAPAGSVDGYDAVPEDVLDHDEPRRLSGSLGTLTPLQREAIDLAYFGGLTYEETARRLDAAAGTVRSRIREGIIRLRSDLSPGV
ncbi:sigma-70 family RNA polymerase sigma factor [Arthrobacter agilis]|uniref:sigma-70 family RNA polymerase sigma factor n=1 Tax=Arthrobacter agilis TaxID=37921 RepID=UPI000B35E8E5|nr:sigma-70 family RNA polymerase sigma factor [Arthrobacter agilis]OUM45508.1 hypothetical protein B8W74_00675 [Arthrobacter agilis]PPB47724.1 RNA polymerase subunit sigma [Arthrobacter agilis]TPV26589.1 sigma-70 family RNA polymerase sigma factor [Arthrobacter agilis]VDR33493.1 Sigma-K factor [Arthrobacter agilis]